MASKIGPNQHCKEKHLHRYLSEYDSNRIRLGIDDTMRREIALRGITGKRLGRAGFFKIP
jgi:hypothetical protein